MCWHHWHPTTVRGRYTELRVVKYRWTWFRCAYDRWGRYVRFHFYECCRCNKIKEKVR